MLEAILIETPDGRTEPIKIKPGVTLLKKRDWYSVVEPENDFERRLDRDQHLIEAARKVGIPVIEPSGSEITLVDAGLEKPFNNVFAHSNYIFNGMAEDAPLFAPIMRQQEGKDFAEMATGQKEIIMKKGNAPLDRIVSDVPASAVLSRARYVIGMFTPRAYERITGNKASIDPCSGEKKAFNAVREIVRHFEQGKRAVVYKPVDADCFQCVDSIALGIINCYGSKPFHLIVIDPTSLGSFKRPYLEHTPLFQEMEMPEFKKIPGVIIR